MSVCSSGGSVPTQTNRPSLEPSKGKGLAFDPLAKPKSKRAHPQAAPPSAAAPFGGFGAGFGAIPPDIADQDDLSAGFQRMMAELAQGVVITPSIHAGLHPSWQMQDDHFMHACPLCCAYHIWPCTLHRVLSVTSGHAQCFQ